MAGRVISSRGLKYVSSHSKVLGDKIIIITLLRMKQGAIPYLHLLCVLV